MMPQFIGKNPHYKNIWNLTCVLLCAFLQAFVLETFLLPTQLLSAGFTGVAILLNRISLEFTSYQISTSFFIVILNLPVALVCAKTVGKKFTLYSSI